MSVKLYDVFHEIDLMYDAYGDGVCRDDPGNMDYTVVLRTDDGQERLLSSDGLRDAGSEWLWSAGGGELYDSTVDSLYDILCSQKDGAWDKPVVIGCMGREYRPAGFYVEFDRVCDMGFNMVFRIREDAGCQG